MRLRPAEAAPPHTYLLDEDDDLAAIVDDRTLAHARRSTSVRVLRAETGQCDLRDWFAGAGDGPGLMVLEGLLALEVHLGGRTATELLGAGDLLMVPHCRMEEMVRHNDVWRVLAPVRVAVLDESFLERVRAWPSLTRALMRRVSQRVSEVDALRAISCHPRLEVRLVLLLWHLGSRWGRVEPSGIRLTLPLTHRLLGQLVGAERPSISHALRRLDRCGLVSGGAGDLHLHGTVEEHLNVLAERADPRQRRMAMVRPAM